MLRTLGQVAGRMRRLASEFQGQFMEAMREAELDDLEGSRRGAIRIVDSVKVDAAFDPLAEARKQIKSVVEGACPPRARPSRARAAHPSQRRPTND